MADLTIETISGERGTVVKLIGDADATSVGTFKKQVEPIVHSDDPPKVLVLDLSQLDFAASLVLGRIMVINGELKAAGGVLKIAAPKPLVAEVLNVGRFDRVVPICNTVQEALEI